jgi:hypothetical protein
MDWAPLIAMVNKLSLRTCIESTDRHGECEWSTGLGVPVRGYLETRGFGPAPFRLIAWIDIDPIEVVHRGLRVAPLRIDHSATLPAHLDLMGARYELGPERVRVFGAAG